MTRYLSIEDVLAIHIEVVSETGGSVGVRDLGLLDSAVHRPEAGFGGVEMYATIASKGAALLHSLVSNHPFIDGNKRTGFAALNVFLRLNGLRLTATDDGIYGFVMEVARSERSVESISAWIEMHCTPLREP